MGSILPSLGSLGTLPSFSQIESEVSQAGNASSGQWTLNPNIDLSPGAPTPAQQDTIDKAASESTGFFGLTTARVATFVVGILCIGAGLLMFKQTQTIITGAGRAAATLA